MLDPNGPLIADRFLAGPPGPADGGVKEREALDKLTGLRCRVFEIDLAAREEDYAALLERWSGLLLGVRHPSLENLLAARAGADGRTAWWIFEETAGKTFAALAEEKRPFSESEAAGLAAALAGALRAARDGAPDLPPLEICPANLYLAPGGRPVLAGTRYFAAAPGAARWRPPQPMPGPAAELYALGSSLGCLFTGLTPEELRAGGAAGLKKATGFSDDLCGILGGLTAGRYRSAAELERELARFLAGAPPSKLRAAGRALLAAALLLASARLLSELEPGGPVKLRGGEAAYAVPGGLAFSAAGDLLALAGDKELYLWTSGSWKRQHDMALQNLDGRLTRSVAFFPDGRIAVGSATGEGVSRVRLLTGALLPLWDAPLPAALDSLAVSPDGRLLAAAVNEHDESGERGVKGRVLLFDASALKPASIKPLRELATPGGPAQSVSFSADGRYVIYRTMQWQESSKLYNLGRVVRRAVDGGEEEALFADDEGGFALGLFAIAPDGTAALPRPGSELLEVRAPGGRLLARLNEDSGLENYVYTTAAEGAFSRDGRLFAAPVTRGGRVRLRVYDARGWRLLREFKMDKWRAGPPAGVAFSPDGRLVAAAQGDASGSTVRVYDLDGKKR